MTRLAGKVVIVTGTSPNIGGGIAEGLADEGAKVVCVDVAADNAMQCADWIVRRGGDALGITCDVTDEAQVEAMVARVRDGSAASTCSSTTRGSSADRAWSTCRSSDGTGRSPSTSPATSSAPSTSPALMIEQKRRGSIVVIVSTAGHQGQAGQHRVLHEQERPPELHARRRDGPRQARHPREQPHADRDRHEEGQERAAAWGRPRQDRGGRMLDFAKMVPMGELPSPKHYAKAIAFLASDDAEMITGFDLRVDAGAIAKYWPWIPN